MFVSRSVGGGHMPGRPLGSATVILLSFQKLFYVFNFIIANTDRSLLWKPVRQLYKLRNNYMYFPNTIQISICRLTMTIYFLFYTIVCCPSLGRSKGCVPGACPLYGPKFSQFHAVVWKIRQNDMSHFAYACKMRCPLNLVLENFEYLWFYWTFCIVILDCGLKLHKLSNHTLVMLQKWLEIH